MTAAPARSVPVWRLWFPLVVAPAAWAAQGGLGWLLGARVCDPLSTSAARGLIALVSVAMLLLVLVATLMAARTWRTVSPEASLTAAQAWDRTEFLAAGGLFVSSLFALGIVWAALGGLLLTRCGSMR